MIGRYGILDELRNRGVVRAVLVYLAAGFATLEFADIAFPRLGFPDEAVNIVLWVAILGLPVVIVLAWMIEVRAEPDRGEPKRWLSMSTFVAVIALAGAGIAIGFLWEGAPEVGRSPPAAVFDVRGPTVVVLPFVDLAGDDPLFATGLSEEIGTALARFSGLRVIPPSATQRFRGHGESGDALVSAPDVDYFVRGTIQRSGDEVRAAVQLIDGASGSQLWGENYAVDAAPARLFATQAEIAGRVSSTIGDASGVVSQQELDRVRQSTTQNSEAYRCVLLAQAYLNVHTQRVHREARDCLVRAVELDPSYADAWAHLGYMYREEFLHRYAGEPEPLERAIAAAERSIQLDRNNAMAYFALAFAYASLKQFDDAIGSIERMVLLAPNDTAMLGGVSIYLAHMGRWERAIELADRVEQLNPLHNGWTHYTRALERFHVGDHAGALAQVRLMRNADATQDKVHLVANLAMLGRTSDARAAAERLISSSIEFRADPSDSLGRIFIRDEWVARYADALRLAGIRIVPGEPATLEPVSVDDLP